jgi:hypothetical protein
MKKSKKGIIKFSNFEKTASIQLNKVLGGASNNYNSSKSNTAGVAAPSTTTIPGTQG